jgi:hypothetical protein
MKPTWSKIISGIVLLVGGLGFGLKGCHFPVTFWPIEPTNVEHEIGNSGGEFQQYNGNPAYFHTGIDILDDSPAPDGPFVRTTRAGTAILSLVNAGSLYNGLTVDHGDSNGSEYAYWHLDFNSVQQAVRDADTDGTTLPADSRVAQLVDWTACDYHHLHYETCDNNVCEDPVWFLTPRDDNNAPAITEVRFTENGTNTAFPPGFPTTTVRGQVDIIAKAFDRQFGEARTGVMRLRYRISDSNGTIVKTSRLINFAVIPDDANVTVLYRNSSPFDSDSNYCGTEQYYYVVTNVSDTAPTSYSEDFAWDTTQHTNGNYIVEVTAYDAVFNATSLIKFVEIDN